MTITALPTPPARSDAPATFVARADAFLGALPAFGTEANALATSINAALGAVTSGTAIQLALTFNSSITMGTDPGADGNGCYRLNHATPASALFMTVDDKNSSAASILGLLGAMNASTSTGRKGQLRLHKDASNYQVFTVTTVTDATTYYTLGISHIATVGTISAGNAVTAYFTSTGDMGVFSGDLANANLAGIKVATFYANVSNTWGATTNVSFATGQLQKITASTSAAATTINITAPPPASKCCHLQIQITASTSANTYSWSGATVKWVGATWAGTAANKEAFINLFFDGTTYWAQGSNEV